MVTHVLFKMISDSSRSHGIKLNIHDCTPTHSSAVFVLYCTYCAVVRQAPKAQRVSTREHTLLHWHTTASLFTHITYKGCLTLFLGSPFNDAAAASDYCVWKARDAWIIPVCSPIIHCGIMGNFILVIFDDENEKIEKTFKSGRWIWNTVKISHMFVSRSQVLLI